MKLSAQMTFWASLVLGLLCLGVGVHGLWGLAGITDEAGARGRAWLRVVLALPRRRGAADLPPVRAHGPGQARRAGFLIRYAGTPGETAPSAGTVTGRFAGTT
jgi:hypothetical protein